VTDDQAHGVVATVSSGIIKALPGQMLLLLLLNMCWIGSMVWLLQSQNSSRERILGPLLEACSKTIPLEALPHMPRP
jgi:hypothetical protein